MSSPALTLLLVDDHFVVRSGLKTSLELVSDITVVAEAARGEEAIIAYRRHQPSVVVMDLQLPGMGGINATEALCAGWPRARILVFSNFTRENEILSVLNAGALGYVPKSVLLEELLLALRTVAEGRRYLPLDLAQRLKALRVGPSITPREREILTHIAVGHANKEIADVLNISEQTVKRHVSQILDKMSVNDRAQAAVEAIRRGLVQMPE